jgi:hypothetical protein
VKTCARETLTIAGFSLDGKRDRLYELRKALLPKTAVASLCQPIGPFHFLIEGASALGPSVRGP